MQVDFIPREITFRRNNGLNFQSTDQHRVNTGIMRVNIDRDSEEEESLNCASDFQRICIPIAPSNPCENIQAY